MGYGGQL